MMKSAGKIFIACLLLNYANSSFAQANASAIQKRWIAVDVVGSKVKKDKYGKMFARHATEMEFKNEKFFSYQDGVLQGTAAYTMAGDGKSLVVKENGKTQISLKIISLNNETLQAVMYGFMSDKDTIIYKVTGTAVVKELAGSRESANWTEVVKKWSDLTTQRQREYDLLRNLINTVKGTGGVDQQILDRVTEARNNAASVKFEAGDLSTANIKKDMTAQQELTTALNDFSNAIDKNPALKSGTAILQMRSQLDEVKNRRMVNTNDYNYAVMNYNISVKNEPAKTKDIMIKASAGSEQSPKVGF